MKKLLLATAATAMFATPALADGNNRNTDTETFTIRANNPAKCNLEATDYTLRLPGNSLSDNDGFARSTVSQAVADEMNGAGVVAWCTGSSNTLQMYRTAFVLNGASNGGNQADDGFNQALIYDVAIAVAGATRSDGTQPIEGTADGQENGPGVGVGGGLTVSRFGPSGTGAIATFTAESDSNATSLNAGTDARSAFTENSNRLVAGQYTSTLTIELTPGV